MKVLTCPCCDGICGPQTGCNCIPCQELEKEEAREFPQTSPIITSSIIHQSWTWGRKPSSIELQECLDAIVNEQRASSLDHASNSLFANQLWHRLIIQYRYFMAISAMTTLKVPRPLTLTSLSKSSLTSTGIRARFVHFLF